MSLKKDCPKVEYKIKLLSGNNVVLVEANGFESEIFVPEIQNGRISFQNIVPNRRCCYTGNTPTAKSLLRKKRRSLQSNTEHHSAHATPDSMSPCQTWRLQGGVGVNDINRTRSPLAFSTPAPVPSPTPSFIMKHHLKYNKENYEPRQPRTLAQAYNTIELLRPKLNSPLMQRTNQCQHTPETKTVRIQCEQSEIDKHMREKGGGRDYHGGGDSGSDFKVPDVPTLTPCSLKSSNKNKSKTPEIQAMGTVTKWRKCLTPKRTYSRNVLNVPSLPASSNMKKMRHTKPCATQGTKGEFKIEVKRRKLIVDPKTAISPSSFKRQLRRLSIESERKPDSLPRDRKRYDTSKNTAFDMLTTPNRNTMAAKLQQQFRKACINKASSTCPKYKILCKLAPLEEPGKARVNNVSGLPSCSLTAAAMMEKACSNAMQTCEHAMHSKHMHWSSPATIVNNI